MAVEILQPENAKVSAPGTITFQAKASGGHPPYTLNWDFSPALQANPAAETQQQADQETAPPSIDVAYPESAQGQKGLIMVEVTDAQEHYVTDQVEIYLPSIEFKEISFTTAQRNLYRGSLLNSTSLIESPEYSESQNESFVNAPGVPTSVDIQIDVQPSDTPSFPCTVEAQGGAGLDFEQETSLVGGTNQLQLTASSSLPEGFHILDPNLEWVVRGSEFFRRLLWRKKTYTLPFVEPADNNERRTEARLQWIHGVVGSSPSIQTAADALFDLLDDQFTKNGGGITNSWYLASGSGADCQTIVRFIKICLDMIDKKGSQVKFLFARANKTAVERDVGAPQPGDHSLLDGTYPLTPATYATASNRTKTRAYFKAYNIYEAVLNVPGAGYYAPGVGRNYASAQAVLNDFVKASAGDEPEVFEWW